mmetsp:Transcript_14680/g.40506  ORF Transcript_14680/g.40506 Transcript_14680/m.40506 type:complete len:169 (-) Transcript_14680:525-1031(-)
MSSELPGPCMVPAWGVPQQAVPCEACQALFPLYCPSELLAEQWAVGGCCGYGFSGPHQFKQWLCSQPYSLPWAKLVTSWRHAKNCADGIFATRKVASADAPSICIACVLVIVNTPLEESRAKKWAQEACKPTGALGPAIPVVVRWRPREQDEPAFFPGRPAYLPVPPM